MEMLWLEQRGLYVDPHPGKQCETNPTTQLHSWASWAINTTTQTANGPGVIVRLDEVVHYQLAKMRLTPTMDKPREYFSQNNKDFSKECFSICTKLLYFPITVHTLHVKSNKQNIQQLSLLVPCKVGVG
jgi:hypothetical protein